MGTEYVYEDEDGTQYVYSDDEQATPQSGLMGADDPTTPEYDGAVMRAAKPDGWLSSAFKSVFGDEQSDVYKNEKGNYVQKAYLGPEEGIKEIPEFESQAGARKTAQGMSMVASMAPGLALSSKLPMAASLFGRVFGNYLPSAAVSSASSIGADKISQARGDLQETTGKQDADRFVTDTAIGTLVPTAIEGAGDAIKWLAGKVSGPQRTARMLGATPTEMNTNRPFPVQKSVEWLDENSPFFQSRVLGKGDIIKSDKEIGDRLLTMGKDIETLYGNNGNITATLQELESHPAIKRLEQIALDDASPPDVAKSASDAYSQIMGPANLLARKNGGNLQAQDMWRLRKRLDDIANLETQNPTLSDEYLSGARGAVKDTINLAIERTAPQEAATLKALNEEYHHLANVKTVTGRGVAKTGEKLPLVDEKIGTSLPVAVARLSGLGTQTGRAAAYNIGRLAGAVQKRALPIGLAGTQIAEDNMSVPQLPGAEMMSKIGGIAGVSEAQSQERDPMVQPLSRDTENINPEFLTQFLSSTAQQPNAIIGQQLVQKLDKAMKAGDMDTMEKLHADMARLFPDQFEPGNGVNGKLFHPDEQAKAMATLKQLNRMGMVDSIHLAKQRNAFNNPQDSRVLPVTPKMPEQPSMGGNFTGARRTYGY